MNMNWQLAARAKRMNPSVIREILKVTEKPGIISFAGGLPSQDLSGAGLRRGLREGIARRWPCGFAVRCQRGLPALA